MTVEQRINAANQVVMNALLNGQPTWVDVRPAGAVIPGMRKNLMLVAGPPMNPENRIPAVKTAVCGAAVHEGLAGTEEEAWNMVLAGEIDLKPAQDYGCACGAAMATSYSMPVLVAKDEVNGTYGYSAPHPGKKGKVLRWGCYDGEVEQDLRRFRDSYGPGLGEGIRKLGGINLRNVLAKTAGMGDENHNRQPAASMLMALEFIPALLDCGFPGRDAVIKELAANDRFFLHAMMAGCMSVIESIKNTPMSTVMVGMGGNGVEFGLQFAGTGKQWFCTTAPKILGQFLNPSWTAGDMAGYLGDSCVTEIYGLGGMSAIAGPSFVRLTGDTFELARQRTENARAVCLGEHKFAPIPWDDFRGLPVGVDMRRVVGLGIVPTSHGGGALLQGGQGSAGAVDIPMECFRKGLIAFSKRIKEDDVP